MLAVKLKHHSIPPLRETGITGIIGINGIVCCRGLWCRICLHCNHGVVVQRPIDVLSAKMAARGASREVVYQPAIYALSSQRKKRFLQTSLVQASYLHGQFFLTIKSLKNDRPYYLVGILMLQPHAHYHE